MNRYLYSEIELTVLGAVRASTKPVSREQLELLTHLPDRQVREIIAILQERGHRIVSLLKGYKLATEEEWNRYVSRERRRAFTILSKLRGAIPKVKEFLDQFELFEGRR